MRDFMALMDLAIADGAPTGVFNVSTGEGHSIKDVFDQVGGVLGIDCRAQRPGSADRSRRCQGCRARSVSDRAGIFGWTARVGFADTIRRQLQWYDRHGVTDVYTHLAAPAGRISGASLTRHEPG